jgi:hypothetical protein
MAVDIFAQVHEVVGPHRQGCAKFGKPPARLSDGPTHSTAEGTTVEPPEKFNPLVQQPSDLLRKGRGRPARVVRLGASGRLVIMVVEPHEDLLYLIIAPAKRSTTLEKTCLHPAQFATRRCPRTFVGQAADDLRVR